MAWWVQQEWDSDQHRIVYSTDWIESDGERFAEATAHVERELTDKYLTPDPGPRPWNPPSPYDPLHGFDLLSGFRYPVSDKPYRVRITEKVTYLADILGTVAGKAITPRVVDAIEQIEPGVHQYLPCEIYSHDGHKLPGQRWILNICVRIDSIAIGKCNVVELAKIGLWTKGNGKTDIKVWKEIVSGHALWTEWRMIGAPRFASDNLVEQLRLIDAHGWLFNDYLPEI